MNKIVTVTIEGKTYNTAMLTALTLSEFVIDVNKADTKTVCRKYNVLEVK